MAEDNVVESTVQEKQKGASSDDKSSKSEKRSARGPYRCARCGQPKKGHRCPYDGQNFAPGYGGPQPHAGSMVMRDYPLAVECAPRYLDERYYRNAHTYGTRRVNNEEFVYAYRAFLDGLMERLNLPEPEQQQISYQNRMSPVAMPQILNQLHNILAMADQVGLYEKEMMNDSMRRRKRHREVEGPLHYVETHQKAAATGQPRARVNGDRMEMANGALNVVGEEPWSEMEMVALVDGLRKYGQNWQQLAAMLNGYRSIAEVRAMAEKFIRNMGSSGAEFQMPSMKKKMNPQMLSNVTTKEAEQKY